LVPKYFTRAKEPTLTAARLKELVPFSVRVPQFSMATAGFIAAPGVRLRTAPEPVATPLSVRLLMVTGVLPACVTASVARW